MGGRREADPEPLQQHPEGKSNTTNDNLSHQLQTSDTSSAPDNSPGDRSGCTTTLEGPNNRDAASQNARLPAIDTLTAGLPRVHIRTPSTATPRTPREAGLSLQTHITTPTPSTQTTFKSSLGHAGSGIKQEEEQSNRQDPGSSYFEVPLQRGGSLRSTLSTISLHSAFSPSPSALNSPALNALPNITPLPSPLATQESPKLWKTRSRPGSSGSLSRSLREDVLLDAQGKISPTKNKMNKGYGSLGSPKGEGSNLSSHKSNRSVSEFQPGPMHNERPRTVTAGTMNVQVDAGGDPMQVDSALHREKYLAEQRGLVHPPLPTPPPSNRSVTESEADESAQRDDAEVVSYLTVREGLNKRKRKYRPVRPLGSGTFSNVVLATSQKLPPTTKLDETSETWLDPHNLVAIKVVQHGPAGGANADRMDVSLRREVELLGTLSHPTLIQLKAFDTSEQEALIVLNYCPGGDLFDLASGHRELLTPPIVQRVFAELVAAISYLHSLWIVHRDVKLENVLLNIPAAALADISDPFNHPYPLITLTDLGLSRTIPRPPERPELKTRCGSEDYAAPEILLGSPYDGRQTDAWALGVLTYALMEGRLPFDPPPVRPGQRPNRSKPSHRIARCDWIWCAFGDVDGEWDDTAGTGWEGARGVVESLLKKVTRGRATMDYLAKTVYVRAAITCEGGLRRPPHADDHEEAQL